MSGKYAYSYNGENYRGTFSSRDEACRRALECMGGLLTLPAAIYVGRMVSSNPQAAGLARRVIDEMTARGKAAAGGAAGDYLSQITDAQLRELDSTLEMGILGWLQKNGLTPRMFTVDAISEHPVPTVSQVRETPLSDEVNELGTTEYPAVEIVR